MDEIGNKKTGVVLAAGLGSRLAEGRNNPDAKPLVHVDGKSLLLRTLQSLEICCFKVVIVLGFEAEAVRNYVEEAYSGPLELAFTVNEQFVLSNGVSVLAAEEFIDDHFVLCMADHILSDELPIIARDYIPVANSGALLVDYKIDSIFDLDDATKVFSGNGRILRIGKQLSEYNCIDTGVFVCTKALFTALKEVYRAEGDVSLSDGIQALCKSGMMFSLDIKDGFWQDVDTVEMLEYAEQQLALKTNRQFALAHE